MLGRRLLAAVIGVTFAVVAGVFLSACGGDSGPTADQVATIKRQVLDEARARARSAKADRELQQLKREMKQLKKKQKQLKRAPAAHPNNGTSASGGAAPSAAAGATGSSCGGGISVNSVTSCSFAANVAAAFYDHGAGTVYASSPVTGQTYAMSCTGGVPTVCTGGNGAAVYIR